MGLTRPSSLSPSSISTFTSCPLSFRFAYIDRLPQPPSPWTVKGTLVHRALELLHNRPPSDRDLGAALADLATAGAELAGEPEMALLGLSAEEEAAFRADAEALVRRYFELEDPSIVRAIGLELKLRARLHDEPGAPELRGVIDRLELDAAGELVITDYKTGSVPREHNEQSRLAGVRLYALLCERVFGRRPARVQLLYLSEPVAIIATPSEQSVRGSARKATALWSAVERACDRDDFRPHPSRLCDFCAFRAYCPAFGGDPAAAEELRPAIAPAGPAPGAEPRPGALPEPSGAARPALPVAGA